MYSIVMREKMKIDYIVVKIVILNTIKQDICKLCIVSSLHFNKMNCSRAGHTQTIVATI